jgi:TetR/AcrR family transcriptional regulator, transcriptional repressor for nem operon
MRYSTEHKKVTRERIVRTASRHFRRRGGKGVAIADLMSKLDLTHGGFYKHFNSKEELLAEAIAKAFDETESRFTEAVSKAKPGTELKTLIENYLSLEHCANPGEGCPMAALASEIGRFPRAVRTEIERAMKRRVKRTARFLPGATERERERNCLALLSGLIGTVNVARALADPEARKAVLDASKNFYIKSFCS